MSAAGQRRSSLSLGAGIVGVAAAYLATGELSLATMPAGYPPAVWAPAGLALVAVLLGGMRFAPAVALGSFALNFLALTFHPRGFGAGPTVMVAVLLGIGAALQACAGAYLVRRFVASPTALDEARDVGLFLMMAGPVASVVNATVATLALHLAGATPAGDLWLRWSTWWLADASGALLVAPLLLLWLSRPRQMPGRRLWVTAPLLLAGTAVVVLFARATHWEQARLDATLRRRADAVSAALERGSDHYLHVVQSIADLHKAAGRVERGAFQLFVKGALGRDPGIRSLGWLPRVTEVDRAENEAGARREGQEGYGVKEWVAQGRLGVAGDRPEYFPLLFVEPERDSEGILGLDLASSPRWRAELEESARTGQAAAGIDDHTFDQSEQTFVALAPIFSEGIPIPAQGEPPRPSGFAIGICSLDALVDSAMKVSGRDSSDLVLQELAGPAQAGVVYRPAPRPPVADVVVVASPRIAGRTWTMKLAPSLHYQASERSWQPWLVLTSGMLFVTWLEAFLLIITGRTSRVEMLVAQRTSELEVSNRAVEEQRSELTRSNAELAAALTAKEILLRELHHRVKNNLQVIASLFSLQARYLPDPRYREIFEESRNRVFSIALAHEKLYRSKDLGRIDFSEYARNLIGHLHSMFGTSSAVSLVTDIHEVTLPVEMAIPCGLVINELVTNAFKHAFPAGRQGAIRVVLREVDSARWMVAVEDDGIGLPAGINLGKADSLGLDLVSILAAQIGADVELTRERGTSFRLTFSARRRADA
jgi:two-component sensor histidine kinase/CHASE1-domain containing sensor protein